MAEKQDRGRITDRTLVEGLARLDPRRGRTDRIDEASLRRDNGRAMNRGLVPDAAKAAQIERPKRTSLVTAATAPTIPPGPAATSSTAPEPPVPVVESIKLVPADGRGIALDIAAALADVRDRAGLSVSIAGVPADARLSAGTSGPYGGWQVDAADLDDLALILPADFDATVTLFLTAASGEDPSAIVARLAISVEPPAAAADGAANDADPPLGEPIALDIVPALADLLDRRDLVIHVAGVPAGARLSVGTAGRDGLWTLDPADLDGLTIALPVAVRTVSLIISALAAAGDVTPSPRVLARLVVNVETDAAAPPPALR